MISRNKLTGLGKGYSISHDKMAVKFEILSIYSSKELWKQPFHNLCASNDDGAKLLWLQFRGSADEDELILSTNPKVIVFTIHNFLSAKLHNMSNKAAGPGPSS